MLDCYYEREADIIKKQALWRGRRDIQKLSEIVTLKVKERRRSIQQKNLRDLARYEKQVVVIQRAWRARKARQQWAEMLSSGMATLETVVRHMHLLFIMDQDFREELDLQAEQASA